MKENTRIRFNPVTKEVEIEGSELFVKTYFKKLQAMVSGSAEKTTAMKPKTVKASKEIKPAKKITNIEKVTTLVKHSKAGISTARLKEETGLSERQIWSIVNRAANEGKIRKMKRGLYGAPE